MFSIVLCHYVSWLPRLQWTGQFFNVGVPLFFIISGFLYGNKTIDSIKYFFVGRFFKVILPLYVYYLIMILMLSLIGRLGTIKWIDSLKVVLCLKGFIGGGLVIL